MKLPSIRASTLLATAYVLLGVVWIGGSRIPFTGLFSQDATVKVLEIFVDLGFVLVSGCLLLVATRYLYGRLDFAFHGLKVAEARATESEAAVRNLESGFQLLFRNNPQPMFLFDIETLRFVEANDAMVMTHGWSRDELLEMTLPEIVPAEDRAALQAEILDPRHTPAFGEQHTIRRKDGSVVRVDILAHAIPWAGGRRCELVIPVDITAQAEQQQRLSDALHATVMVLTRVVDARDPYTAGHEVRVGAIAARIAAEIGFDEESCDGIRVCGELHDIGKLGVPYEILNKPTRLDDDERRVVHNHPLKGHDILNNLPFPWRVAEVALHHHERWDGSGYPDGLKEMAIPLEARIVAVADVFESMVNHRPYRPALGWQEAMDEIASGRGTLYDPDVVDAFLRVTHRVRSFDDLVAPDEWEPRTLKSLQTAAG